MDANGTLSVINAPNSFTMNLQDENFHHNNFVITAANTTSVTTALTLDLGNAVTNEGPDDINENWSVNGYSTVNIVLAGDDDIHLGSEGGFFVNPNGGSATINISGTTTDNNEMHFGNVGSANIFDYLDFNQFPVLLGNGVLTQAGSIVDTANTFLELGITDATSINAATGGGLFMEDPTSSIFQTLNVTGSTGDLQQPARVVWRWQHLLRQFHVQQRGRRLRDCWQGEHHWRYPWRQHLGYRRAMRTSRWRTWLVATVTRSTTASSS